MKMEFAVLGLVAVLVVAGAAYFSLGGIILPQGDGKVVAFSSEQDFRDYLEYVGTSGSGYYGANMDAVSPARNMDAAEDAGGMQTETDGASAPSGLPPSPERVSETNVQVLGIDEPDIIKTDGSEIYYSPQGGYYPMMRMAAPAAGGGEEGFAPDYYDYTPPTTKAVSAMPPSGMEIDSEIEMTGEMLLHDETLVILSYDGMTGYDVSDPTDPQEKWKISFNGSMNAARLFNGKIYLVTTDYINSYDPCPIVPVAIDGKGVTIPCTRIYHPSGYVSVDTLYNAMVINPEDGDVEKAVSFAGTASSSVVYMSESGIYVTYAKNVDTAEFLLSFFRANPGVLPAPVVSDLERVMAYDISMQAKMTEFSSILEEYTRGLDEDAMLKLQNDMQSRLADYLALHKRDLIQTGIVKISHDMEIAATGMVPGTPLNQFSLDEYQGNLRIAVTVGGSWMFGGSQESANDVYVLDGSLSRIGAVTELGLTERVYSARFIQDKGYVVTFRQTDPFYVLDLSDPASPKLAGELKIPGYSAYLHPITKDKIIGIGKEGQYVKVSLFDATDPANPVEVSKYTLSEYWSDILNTHHAFLMDEKHGVFFLPGSSGGYIFSYEDDTLSLVKAVSDIQAKRAIYINDYMYIAGDDKIVVLDETTWERVGELSLSA
ncbi:MAG: beta-propeller domain-containing protein [Candidatus Aenigmatarchaeota archaeon]